MAFNPDKPFNSLPPLPPKADLETTPVLKAAIIAHRALAELKGVGGLIPNQSILVHAVALQEAQLSSEIEGIITTNDALYRALSKTADSADDPQAKEVLRYADALWHGFDQMKKGRPLSTRLYEEMVCLITQNAAGIRKTPGTTLRDQRTDKVVYTPPEGERVIRELITNLDKYLHNDSDGVEPLAKLGVIHYQFEAIHPFADGNGRTGRILNILYLVHRGLLDLPILYLSRYVIENKPAYYSHLRNITEREEWEPWILFMLEAVRRTAVQTLGQIRAIRDLMSNTAREIHAKLPKVYSKELVEVLFDRPYCKIAFLVDAKIAGRQTASTYLRSLEEEGIITSAKIGRETIYVNRRYLKLLRKPPVDGVDISA